MYYCNPNPSTPLAAEKLICGKKNPCKILAAFGGHEKIVNLFGHTLAKSAEEIFYLIPPTPERLKTTPLPGRGPLTLNPPPDVRPHAP